MDYRSVLQSIAYPKSVRLPESNPQENMDLQVTIAQARPGFALIKRALNYIEQFAPDGLNVHVYDHRNWDADRLGAMPPSAVFALTTNLGHGEESVKIYFPKENIGFNVAGLYSSTKGSRIHYHDAEAVVKDIYRTAVGSGRVSVPRLQEELAHVATVATTSSLEAPSF